MRSFSLQRRACFWIAGALALAVLGCAEEPLADDSCLALLELTPSALRLHVGDSAGVAATVQPCAGGEVAPPFLWIDAPRGVVSLRVVADTAAIVKAVGPGTTLISVNGSRRGRPAEHLGVLPVEVLDTGRE